MSEPAARYHVTLRYPVEVILQSGRANIISFDTEPDGLAWPLQGFIEFPVDTLYRQSALAAVRPAGPAAGPMTLNMRTTLFIHPGNIAGMVALSK